MRSAHKLLAIKNGFTMDGEPKAEFLVLVAVHSMVVAQEEPEAPSKFILHVHCCSCKQKKALEISH